MNRNTFVLAGQSNMAGRGKYSELPPHFQHPQKGILYQYYLGFARDPGRLRFTRKWKVLGPGPAFPSTEGPQFGPELSLGDFLRRNFSSPIRLIKVALGGTNLVFDWNPDSTTGKRLYAKCLERTRSALEDASPRNQSPNGELAAFFWMQGESDSTRAEWAQEYASSLAFFIQRLRQDSGRADLPFIMGKILNRTNVQMKYAEIVQNAQVDVAKQLPGVILVDTEDLPDIGDGTHFTSEGLLELGRRFAASYLQAENRGNTGF